ncbi:MAG: hypothetical protein SFV81_18285, partial [Pirellulaceae bacterium]|nr:hypothetical protein [Pirellulaceae bacterium]
MSDNPAAAPALTAKCSRRTWLQSASAVCAGGLAYHRLASNLQADAPNAKSKAQIAITLDLEMARNFPRREDLHWDYEKGNLDEATKKYAVAAGQRVK